MPDANIVRVTRPTPAVLLGCLLSLFAPGLGHIVLGLFREGAIILGIAAGTFSLGLLIALVFKPALQIAALPLFFVWLFALQDLWGRRRGADSGGAQPPAP